MKNVILIVLFFASTYSVSAQTDTTKKAISAEDSTQLEEKKKIVNVLIKSADLDLETGNYSNAEVNYKKALSLEKENKYCLKQLEKLKVLRSSQQDEKSKNEYEILKKADEAFAARDFQTACKLYERHLKMNPNNPAVQDRLKQAQKLSSEK